MEIEKGKVKNANMLQDRARSPQGSTGSYESLTLETSVASLDHPFTPGNVSRVTLLWLLMQ